MIPTRSLIALLVLTLGYGTAAWCDDAPKAEAVPDPCVTELTLEKLDNPPQRKTNFVRVQKPLEIPLNIKLVDQKYAASIDIVLPIRSGRPFNPIDGGSERGRSLGILRRSDGYQDAVALHTINGTYLLAPALGVSSKYSRIEPISQALERILAQVPPERMPAEDDLACFKAPESDRLITTTGLSPANLKERNFRIYAPTPEQAEQRARTLLTILDQGFSRPIQLLLLKQRQSFCQRLAEQKQQFAAAEQQYQEAGEELKKYVEYTPDTLPALRVQQFQSEIELAGWRAKTAAYEKLLAKVERGAPRFEQLEEAQGTAEVEMASCEARRAAIGVILGKIQHRAELTGSQAAATAAKGQAQTEVQKVEYSIQLIDDEIVAFGPVRLVDDQVTIVPIDWTREPVSMP